MRINPNLFDKNGCLCLGDPMSPRHIAWHPLYGQDKNYNYVAVHYSDGFIRLFYLEGRGENQKLKLVQNIPSDPWGAQFVWTPDGRYLVTQYECVICFVDIAINRLTNKVTVPHKTSSVRINFSPAGNLLAISHSEYSKAGIIDLCDSKDGEIIVTLKDATRYSAFSPDGKYFVSLHEITNDRNRQRCEIRILDLQTIKEHSRISYNKQYVNNMFFSFRDGTGYLVEATGNSIQHRDIHSGELHSMDPEHKVRWKRYNILGDNCILSADGQYLAGVRTNHIHVWDIQQGDWADLLTVDNNKSSIVDMQFSPDSKRLISCDGNGKIQLWKIPDGTLLDHYGGRPNTLWSESVAISATGNLASLSSTGITTLWSLDGDWKFSQSLTGLKTRTYKGYDGKYASVTFSPDLRVIARSSWPNGWLLLYDQKQEKEIVSIEADKKKFDFNAVVFNRDGSRIGFYYKNESQGCWEQYDISRASVTAKVELDTPVYSLMYSRDDRRLAAAQAGKVQVFCSQTGHLLNSVEIEKSHLYRAVSYSSDNKRIIAGGGSVNEKGCFLKLWDSASFEPLANYEDRNKNESIWSIAFNPTDRIIAAGGSNLSKSSLKLFKLNNRQLFQLPLSCNVIDSAIQDVVFSPDGKYLIVASLQAAYIISLPHILGREWLEEHMNTPLILTAVWFPEESLKYMEETGQGIIARDKPLTRCGECGKIFPVEEDWLGKAIRCPVEIKGRKCSRLLKLNEFTAGEKN